jgi:hypothetical protein
VFFHQNKLELEVLGTIHSIAEIGQQLGWLISALRSSPDDKQMSIFWPTIDVIQCLNAAARYQCEIKTEQRQLPNEAPKQSSNGRCWEPIFRNPGIVSGYPIRRRPQDLSATGLELPLDMMSALADASYLTTIDNRTLLKGFSSMLVPTQQSGGVIFWHLVFNKNGDRVSYFDDRLQKIKPISTEDVRESRHVLGWCSRVSNFVGEYPLRQV